MRYIVLQLRMEISTGCGINDCFIAVVHIMSKFYIHVNGMDQDDHHISIGSATENIKLSD